MVESGMAIPAQMNGLAIDLKTVLPADHDLFTTQKIVTYFDLGDGKACIFSPVKAENVVAANYPLGFNKQMLEDNNLEDPRALWERGEWTWDKFIEYCQVLTQDTDGDGQNDVTLYKDTKPAAAAALALKIGVDVILSEGDSGSLEPHKNARTGWTWNDGKDYYYPIPTDDRSLTNGALTQNPGWDDGLIFGE